MSATQTTWVDAETTTATDEVIGTVQPSEQDLAVLKNAATIAQSLFIKPGNVIVAKNASRNPTLFFNSNTSITFPKEVAIADMAKFMAVLDTIDKPTLELHENYMYISATGSNARFRYMFAEKDAISPWIPKQDELRMKSAPDAVFTLTKASLNAIISASRTMKLQALYIEGSEDGVRLVARKDVARSESERQKAYGGEQYEMNLPGVTATTAFSKAINLSDLKLIAGDYEVSVHSEDKTVLFTGVQNKVRYWVSIQSA